MKKNKSSFPRMKEQKTLEDYIKSENKKKTLDDKAEEKLLKQKKKLEILKKEGKAKKEEIKTEIKERKRIIDQFRGIRARILIAFAVPVILLAVFGIYSYNMSSDAITDNYKTSKADTLNAVSDYLNLGFTSVSGKAVEFMLSATVEDYYKRSYTKDTLEDVKLLRELKEQTMVVRETNSFIQAVHVIAEVGSSISTTGTPGADLYSQFLETDQAKKSLESKDRNVWVGSHELIDEKLKIKNEKYALSLVSKMSKANAFIVLDVSKDQILKILNEVDGGEGSYIGLITPDGRETLTVPQDKPVFADTLFYQDSLKSDQESGLSYEKFGGEEYLYVYSKVGNTGVMVCTLVPKATILKQATDIRNMSFFFIFFASVLAIFIGTLLAAGIANSIAKLMKLIAKASKGDLTVNFESKRKDEFGILSGSLSEMMLGMRKLIGEVADVGLKVSESAGVLSSTSEEILDATKGISFTIDEIEKGVVQQASDTEHSLSQMSNLSDKINQVYSSTYEIERIADGTKGIVSEGLVIIDELNSKSRATTDVTQLVIKEIEDLEEQSHTIGNFVGIINEIASQTNLLSLNASIEAARAGDAGRGFAVVADEIRKLADQSVKAANEIQNIVTQIQNKTKGTAKSAKQAEEIVESQTDALNKTIHVFEDINKHVGNLVSNLDNISIGVKGIETAKEDTLDAIRNISAVAQQTAAASEEVSATANNQIGSVESLSESAVELAEDARKLEKAIQLFRIN
ncbi:MAG: methyl-accepting chemotaxis sensory transducer [Anaerocolumna sp.]|jgi:methyl-accepting chemotaxis protein|nr:methyl-accepting chemotaxis sensory transducer [Anaerocolumna sp.]